MPTFFVTIPGTTIRCENHLFVAEAPGQPRVSVPEFRVEAIVAFGAAHLTHAAIARVLARHTPVYWLTRYGRPLGMLVPAYDTRADVRLAQFRRHEDAAAGLDFARAVVTAKVRHARGFLQRYQRNHPTAPLEPGITALAEALEHVARAASVASLRGHEGAAAHTYFAALRHLLPAELFDGRSRRPPLDPANALFSLGYTLLGWEICGLLCAAGLDPCLGHLHATRRGLPALAQDLLEIFRTPVVERWAIALLHHRVVGMDDFCAGPGQAMRLSKAALPRVLQSYEAALQETFTRRDGQVTDFRRILAAEIRHLRHWYAGTDPYTPFHWERG